MQVFIIDQPDTLGPFAANLILTVHAAGQLNVLGVATGSSPQPVYAALAQAEDHPLRDLRAVFALDEYVGLPYDHPESYHAVIDRDVTRPLHLHPDRVHVPDGAAEDLPKAASRYESLIQQAGGIDLQILGIGATGHIGFNEPGSSLLSRTRQKTLSDRTRADNARFFPTADDVPVSCLTQGLGTILDAKKIVLVARGAEKAEAVAAAVEGPVTSMCPGSVLQLHPDTTVILDQDAASRLELADYYRRAATLTTP